jgi:hypothetical protein
VKPSVPDVLTSAVNELQARLLTVGDPELLRLLYVTTMALETAAKEYDTCAERRVETIAVLSRLLARGVHLAPGKFSWADDLDGGAADLKISSLDSRLDTLRVRLIELQTWLETAPGSEAAELLDDVFHFEYELAGQLSAYRPLW